MNVLNIDIQFSQLQRFFGSQNKLDKQLYFSLLPHVRHIHIFLSNSTEFYFEIWNPDIIFYYYYPTCAFIYFVSVIISRSVIYEGMNPVLQLHRQKAIKYYTTTIFQKSKTYNAVRMTHLLCDFFTLKSLQIITMIMYFIKQYFQK